MVRQVAVTLVCAWLVPAVGLAQIPPGKTLSTPVNTATDAFTNISSVRELSNGKVIVSDLVDKSVHLLDLAAGTSVQVGREGSGPGEYGFPGELLPLPGDSTLLVDRVNRRFLMILPNGKTGVTIPFPQDAGIADIRGIDRAGRIYFQGSALGPMRGGVIAPPATTPDSVALMRWDRRRNVTDTVTYIKVPSMNMNVSGGPNSEGRAIMFRSQPFSPEDVWAVGPEGQIGVARVRDYHVEWFSPARQRTAGPVNRVPPVPVTDADKEAWRRVMASGPRMTVSVGGGGGSSTRSAPPPPTTPPGSEPDFPQFKPAFPARSAWTTPEGMLWVLRSRSASDPIPSIDVFDQRGVLVSQVKLPENRRVVGFGNGVVYLAHADSDDLQWLERYRR